MFTGIVEELGVVGVMDVRGGHARLEVRCSTVVEDAAVGDSIAVNGCCLTVTALLGEREGFAADLVAETLRATSLGAISAGTQVNLERAMSAGTRFGGHIVQGHVDGVGRILAREDQPGTTWLTVHAPAEVARYLVDKGSVTMQGTSLTVVDVDREAGDATATFRVALIPHTLEVTTWGEAAVGGLVNLEADVIAKYVEQLLAAGVRSPYTTPAGEG